MDAVRGGGRRSPCCPARTRWPGGCPTSTACCPTAAFPWWASISSGWSTACSPRAAPRSPTLKRARSHPVALGQVRNILRELRLQPVIEADTAGAAHLVAGMGGVEDAAIASALAAEIYGLDILRRNVEDAAHNTTRFYVCAPEARTPPPGRPDCVTTFVFRVRNIPAALFKALGGFATNGVNMTKLESYMLDGEFTATQFLADVDGHPEQTGLRLALEELSFFSAYTKILGTYPRAAFRDTQTVA